MIDWAKRGKDILFKCFSGTPIESNDMDWKINLSDNNERTAKHLCAFANNPYGGYLVFGIDNSGHVNNITTSEADEIINRLGSISRNTVTPQCRIESCMVDFKNKQVLLVHIFESDSKPVHMKKNLMDTYIRSATQTVPANEREVRTMLANSEEIKYEDRIAKRDVNQNEIFQYIDYESFFKLREYPSPQNVPEALSILEKEGIIKKSKIGLWDITNLGAILFATDLKNFGGLEYKAVRLIIYKGIDKGENIFDKSGSKGYATSFEALIGYVDSKLPKNENLAKAIRKANKVYPTIALREFIANALIHQDFSLHGTGVTIEIFSDRIEITNPGIPLLPVDRLIDYPPTSRNEKIANYLRLIHICELRGSGIDNAVKAIEEHQLPAPQFIAEDRFTKVIMYAHKSLSRMDKTEKIRACYLHSVICYHMHRSPMNNKSLRDRFLLTENQISVATKIINDTIEAGLIKLQSPETASKRYASYLPYWV